MTTDGKKTILVIDDEQGPRDALLVLLQPHYHVLVACSAAAALDTLALVPVDLITLDLQLPDARGLELLKAIRSHGHDVPVIIVTGHGTIRSAAEAFQQGVVGYVLKPFNPHDLSTTVEQIFATGDPPHIQLPFK